MNVGNIGNGTLTIDTGGQVSAAGLNIATRSGSSGTVTINSGGQVNGTDGFIGDEAGSSGTVTVSGTGSQWNNSSFLTVGNSGGGMLTMANGGMVSDAPNCSTCSAAVLGLNAGSTGAVTVSGVGTTWNNAGQVIVGVMGNGTLNIANGGLVSDACSTCSAAIIGDHLGGTGAATVSGAGSAWNSVGQLTVGNSGNGTLNITNGGLVSDSCSGCAAAILGYYAGSSGSVTVSGSGPRGITLAR